MCPSLARNLPHEAWKWSLFITNEFGPKKRNRSLYIENLLVMLIGRLKTSLSRFGPSHFGLSQARPGLAKPAEPELIIIFCVFFCRNLTLNYPARFCKRLYLFLKHLSTCIRGQMVIWETCLKNKFQLFLP